MSLMPSSDRPLTSSQASTAFESASPSGKVDGALPHSIDEKVDPWLVSFSPDDSDNPLVRCASWPVSTAFRDVQSDLQSWSRWKRWYITTIGGILVLNSSVYPVLEFASAYPIYHQNLR